MNRFERIVQILDDSVGGPTKSVGPPHHAFWRGVSRDQFVALEIRKLKLIELGKGAKSNLVKALRGEAPFDGSDYDQMPYGRDPVGEKEIREIELWIDQGCPEKDTPAESSPVLTWAPTTAPGGNRTYDDVFFLTPTQGWAVNSDGKILATTDGGDNWEEQAHYPDFMLRCLGFASPTRGWVGIVSNPMRLLETTDGTTWTEVKNLPANAPKGICGLYAVNERVVVAAGTNLPNNPPTAIIRSDDGGATWTATDMSKYANALIDVYFPTPQKGWVVGGVIIPPGGKAVRDNLKPVVLFTEDGGRTWTDQAAAIRDTCEFGEWGWKIQFLNDDVGYISVMSFKRGALLKTTDGGRSWRRLPVKDPQGNNRIKGVGFLDEDHGWVGGTSKDEPGGMSSKTADGGATWTDANEIGTFINRFRMFGHPVTLGYAAGAGVFKYADHSGKAPASAATEPGGTLLPERITESDDGRRVDIPLSVPQGAGAVRVVAWDEFGNSAGTIFEEAEPAPGPRTVTWDTSDLSEVYIVRATVDDDSQSQVVVVSPS